MIIREAVQTDNAELLHLTRETPMNGKIILRIDREPDFFRLVSLRGEGKTFVAVSSRKLIGCFSVSEKEVFIDGQKSSVGYFADLRIHPSARGRIAAFRMAKASLGYAEQARSDLFYMVVSDGNTEMISMLTGRAGLPEFTRLGAFNVYSIFPSPIRRRSGKYEISEVNTPELAIENANFVNSTNRNFLFAPVKKPESFSNSTVLENATVTYVARLAGDIVASATTLDASSVKANTVLRLPLYLKGTLWVLRVLRRVFPVPYMPKIGEAIKTLFIRDIAVLPEHYYALRAIVSSIRRDAYTRGYSFVTTGLHELDPRQQIFKKLPHFNFRSHLFFIPSRPDSDIVISKSSVPIVDFSLG